MSLTTELISLKCNFSHCSNYFFVGTKCLTKATATTAPRSSSYFYSYYYYYYYYYY